MKTANSEITDSRVVDWKGVTIEELKFMRASALIRLEIQKEYLLKKASETLPHGMTSPMSVVTGVSNKLTLVQKVILFAKGVRLASSVMSFFKNKRR